MRDKNCIPKMLDELRKIWEERPNLRLGQLIMNRNGYPTGKSTLRLFGLS